MKTSSRKRKERSCATRVQMPMLLLYAVSLVVTTVTMHAVGFSLLLRAIMRTQILSKRGFRCATGLLIALTCWLMLIHLAEAAVWGLFYVWQGWLPDLESSLYFSGVTYTTAGYGDIVLAKPWRMFALAEAFTGTLMCGLTTGLFFAVVSRWIKNWMERVSGPEI